MARTGMESKPVEFIDRLGREWSDISSEIQRRYIFPSGRDILIEEPDRLHVSENGGHRVFSRKDGGTCYYIHEGWVAIEWKVREGEPHFVK